MTTIPKRLSDLALDPNTFQALVKGHPREVALDWMEEHAGSRKVVGIDITDRGQTVLDVLLFRDGEPYVVEIDGERTAATKRVIVDALPPSAVVHAVRWAQQRHG